MKIIDSLLKVRFVYVFLFQFWSLIPNLIIEIMSFDLDIMDSCELCVTFLIDNKSQRLFGNTFVKE